MRNLTTQQRYEVPGGTLRVILETDHSLTPSERRELDNIADACEAFRASELAGAHRAPEPELEAAREVDEAIWELGGDQDIMAG
jgi:hypothetical protein